MDKPKILNNIDKQVFKIEKINDITNLKVIKGLSKNDTGAFMPKPKKFHHCFD